MIHRLRTMLAQFIVGKNTLLISRPQLRSDLREIERVISNQIDMSQTASMVVRLVRIRLLGPDSGESRESLPDFIGKLKAADAVFHTPVHVRHILGESNPQDKSVN